MDDAIRGNSRVDEMRPLTGTRVLIIEDEFFIADDLRRALTKAGATVVGPCASVAKAESVISGKDLDCVILDLNLNGESGAPLADRFLELEVPVVLATGYGSGAVPDRLKRLPRIEKPFDPAKVVELVARLGTQGARY